MGKVLTLCQAVAVPMSSHFPRIPAPGVRFCCHLHPAGQKVEAQRGNLPRVIWLVTGTQFGWVGAGMTRVLQCVGPPGTVPRR